VAANICPRAEQIEGLMLTERYSFELNQSAGCEMRRYLQEYRILRKVMSTVLWQPEVNPPSEWLFPAILYEEVIKDLSVIP